jgi:TPR repeat protein
MMSGEIFCPLAQEDRRHCKKERPVGVCDACGFNFEVASLSADIAFSKMQNARDAWQNRQTSNDLISTPVDVVVNSVEEITPSVKANVIDEFGAPKTMLKVKSKAYILMGCVGALIFVFGMFVVWTGRLGDAYADGWVVAKDDVAATAWYKKSAEIGYTRSMAKLGRRYERGLGVEPDSELAVAWYRRAADSSDARAMAYLGWMYTFGWGVAKDHSKASSWLEKSVDAGDARALAFLGNLYMYGWGISADKVKAISLYRKSFDAGDSYGTARLGAVYQEDGDKFDFKARDLFQRAAAIAEDNDGLGMRLIGECFETGVGEPVDLVKAAFWFERSATLGNSRAMNSLGGAYEHGRGVLKDEARAFHWYQKSAAINDSAGMAYLGASYDRGAGVPLDNMKALYWYQKAANLENADGIAFLGSSYERGAGVAIDLPKAIELYRKAAALGAIYAVDRLKVLDPKVEQSKEVAVPSAVEPTAVEGRGTITKTKPVVFKEKKSNYDGQPIERVLRPDPPSLRMSQEAEPVLPQSR